MQYMQLMNFESAKSLFDDEKVFIKRQLNLLTFFQVAIVGAKHLFTKFGCILCEIWQMKNMGIIKFQSEVPVM